MTATPTTRRAFLRTASTVAAAAPFLSKMPRASAASRQFDPDFGTASEAMGALREGVISSRELTERVFARIRQYNPKINAFVMLLEEQALEQARQADELRIKGRALGALHGLPTHFCGVYGHKPTLGVVSRDTEPDATRALSVPAGLFPRERQHALHARRAEPIVLARPQELNGRVHATRRSVH